MVGPEGLRRVAELESGVAESPPLNRIILSKLSILLCSIEYYRMMASQ